MSLNKVLIADCLKDFCCAGGDCELTCCIGWRIDIDDETVKKYKNCKDIKWRDQFIANMQPPETGEIFHTIKLNEAGACNFLSEYGLCTVQQRFGTGYLSKVCNNYPRTYNVINNQYFEKNYYLSCPAVIKSLLLLERKLTFSQVRENIVLDAVFINQHIKTKDIFDVDFYGLRDFIISVLQDDNYALKERLLILAYFFDSIKEIKDRQAVQEITQMFSQMVASESIKDVLGGVKGDRDSYYELLQSVIKTIFSIAGHAEFKKYCEQMYYKLHLDKEARTNYFYLYDGYYEVFLKKHPFVLENYLVYCVASTLFPLNNTDLWDSFVQLIIRWTIINFCFMGLMSENTTEIKELEFLRCFAAFSRALDALSPSPMKIVSENLKTEGKADIANMFKLIRV